MANNLYQFKITLLNITPTIWRRILVPDNYNFWDLHVAIQDAMGWLDCHLHAFRIKPKHSHKITEIGIPNDDRFEDEPEILPGWEAGVSCFFSDLGAKAEYEYDFGDNWSHEVLLEGHLIKEKGLKYPVCIGGERACPPEDCGGESGYFDFLEIILNPNHKEYKEMVEWAGKRYDPEDFNPKHIKFDNPKKRWKIAFTGVK
ncbi:MAG: plasmid pRiA4b ORF-3 family protein [bacterium]|nr:plasmid pRiA4b ORF-3 family protein [bacterium]